MSTVSYLTSSMSARSLGKRSDYMSVLSPEDLGSERDSYQKISPHPFCSLEITVLSAHNLPKPLGRFMQTSTVIDPLVRVSLCGGEEDSCHADTRRVVDNGFNPRFGDFFEFTIENPEVAIFAFQVLHQGKEAAVGKAAKAQVVAATACPLSGLRSGIRWVPLRDTKHHVIEHCGLLVHVVNHGPWRADIMVSDERFPRKVAAPEPPVDAPALQLIREPDALEEVRQFASKLDCAIFADETLSSAVVGGDADIAADAQVGAPVQHGLLCDEAACVDVFVADPPIEWKEPMRRAKAERLSKDSGRDSTLTRAPASSSRGLQFSTSALDLRSAAGEAADKSPDHIHVVERAMQTHDNQVGACVSQCSDFWVASVRRSILTSLWCQVVDPTELKCEAELIQTRD